ncbi:hypothetical protein Clacol_009578, partial [Clathrus columnatus]
MYLLFLVVHGLPLASSSLSVNASSSSSPSATGTSNVTLPIPGQPSFVEGEQVFANLIAVQGETTIYEIVDRTPPQTQTGTFSDISTFTVAVSPNNVKLNTSDFSKDTLSLLTEDCRLPEENGESDINGGSSTRTVTLPLATFTAVALNFDPTNATLTSTSITTGSSTQSIPGIPIPTLPIPLPTLATPTPTPSSGNGNTNTNT